MAEPKKAAEYLAPIDEIGSATQIASRIRKMWEDIEARPREERVPLLGEGLIEEAIQRGLITESDLMQTCEPVKRRTLNYPAERPYYWILELIDKDGKIRGKYLPEELGIEHWQPARERLPIQRATEVWCQIHRCEKLEDGCRLKFRLIDSAEHSRRERAKAITPEVAMSFPMLAHSLQELETAPWNEQAMMVVRDWLENIDANLRRGVGLSIRHAMTGCGKTTMLTAAILDAVKATGETAYYIYVPDLVGSDYKESEQRIEIAKNARMVLLDDVDAAVKPANAPAEQDSSRSRQMILRIANYRYNKGLTTLWTSNTRLLQVFVFNLGDRIIRRLTERCIALQFGESAWDWTARRAQARETQNGTDTGDAWPEG